jgi:hypothetical protein
MSKKNPTLPFEELRIELKHYPTNLEKAMTNLNLYIEQEKKIRKKPKCEEKTQELKKIYNLINYWNDKVVYYLGLENAEEKKLPTEKK